MIRHIIIITIALAGCKKAPVETWEVLPDGPPWWEADQAAAPVPLGPSDADEIAWLRVKEIQTSRQGLAAGSAADELEPLVHQTSQIWSSAAAMPLFHAGLTNGQGELMELGCTLAARVDNPTLIRVGELEPLLAGCYILRQTAQTAAGPDACATATAGAAAGYNAMLLGDESNAKKTLAKAVRAWSGCENSHALREAPVSPDSRGFTMVVALQVLGTDPSLWLDGRRTSPNTALDIKQGMKAGVSALNTLAIR